MAKRIVKKECEICLVVNEYSQSKQAYNIEDGERLSLKLQGYMHVPFSSSISEEKFKDLPAELRLYSATVVPERNLSPNAMGKLRIQKNLEKSPKLGMPPMHGFIDLPVAFFNSMEERVRECANAGTLFQVDLRCLARIDQVVKNYDGWEDEFPVELAYLDISKQQELEIISFEFSSWQKWQSTTGQLESSLNEIAKSLTEIENTITETMKDELARNGQNTATKPFKDQLARLDRGLEQIKNNQETLRKNIEKKLSSVGDGLLNAHREREILLTKISEPNDLMTKILMKVPIFRSLIRFISK